MPDSFEQVLQGRVRSGSLHCLNVTYHIHGLSLFYFVQSPHRLVFNSKGALYILRTGKKNIHIFILEAFRHITQCLQQQYLEGRWIGTMGLQSPAAAGVTADRPAALPGAEAGMQGLIGRRRV